RVAAPRLPTELDQPVPAERVATNPARGGLAAQPDAHRQLGLQSRHEDAEATGAEQERLLAQEIVRLGGRERAIFGSGAAQTPLYRREEAGNATQAGEHSLLRI